MQVVVFLIVIYRWAARLGLPESRTVTQPDKVVVVVVVVVVIVVVAVVVVVDHLFDCECISLACGRSSKPTWPRQESNWRP